MTDKKKSRAEATLEMTVSEAIIESLTEDHGISSEDALKLLSERSDLITSGVKSLADRIAVALRDSPPTEGVERPSREFRF